MGIVLKAQDTRLNRAVAVKVLAPELAANAAARKRFVREAQAAAAINHPHVVTIYAVDEDQLPYLVMELVDGISLRDRIYQDCPLPVAEILRIGSQIATGLAAAHNQGLIHRDIKPANILLSADWDKAAANGPPASGDSEQRTGDRESGPGQPSLAGPTLNAKLTDFGLARVVDDLDVTQTGEIAGTPQYMSPEQAQGLALDVRSDLFSLGCVLYTMCTGCSPFRAEHAIAVIHRLCHDTPRPVRDANPDIPDWLCAIIDRLLAKQPADRFQTAREVADLLSQHLAQIQCPGSAPLPMIVTPAKHRGPDKLHFLPFERLFVALAVVAVACLAGSLGLAEATGVTQLGATVTRIFTPSGTLIVETDDPAVKVTIEGDGGVVITGAGLHEVHLKVGSYKLQADKNGQPIPLERELVSIAKGGREVVKVKLEAPPAATAAKVDAGAFVVIAAGGERKFDTLAEAVQRASDGDTIEIRGKGPFLLEPIRPSSRLAIRAGSGFHPVIKLTGARTLARAHAIIDTRAPLVLEGLEFRCEADLNNEQHIIAVNSLNVPLHVANCNFRNCQLMIQNPPACRVQNCQITAVGMPSFVLFTTDRTQALVDNNILASRSIVGRSTLSFSASGKWQSVELTHNTLLAESIAIGITVGTPRGDLADAVPSLHSAGNLLNARSSMLRCIVPDSFVDSTDSARLAAASEDLLRRVVAWHEEQNVYSDNQEFLALALGRTAKTIATTRPYRTLPDWDQFWGLSGTRSIQGTIRFQGGNSVYATPDTHIPEDFRLREDSAGYRAGPHGKDLGVDVDLVGPGAAYERWKKAPEYLQWLKETRQMK
jgi:hypothetical protein